MGRSYCRVLFLVGVIFMTVMKKDSLAVQVHDYKDALTKSILFFEGQRSGKLPPTQRMTWRKDSALHDGFNVGLDLTGGYYDAGDNLKFNFPMAFSTTVLAWSVIEFGGLMDSELEHAKEAIKWATDYFLKSTQIPNVVYVQVGEPYSDHNCWQRPEDMDTDRTAYAVNATHPGSEVSAEIAAALAASSIVFKSSDPAYSKQLLDRASQVFTFADKYQGNYNDSLGPIVCPFYCDWGGYDDELAWAASWLYKATNKTSYWKYTVKMNLVSTKDINMKGENCEFGWDDKHAGVYVLSSIKQLADESSPRNAQYKLNADKFVCSLLPESTSKSVKYSPGGLMFKPVGSNMQNPTALSFLLVIYARHLKQAKQNIQCDNKPVTPTRLVKLAKSQVDYILGSNPSGLSYMVGYGSKFPQRIHHRGSSLPSKDQHPGHLECQGGTPYFESQNPNPNVLIGAVTGGPAIDDKYADSRSLFVQSEPTTYINAPLVGLLAYFSHAR